MLSAPVSAPFLLTEERRKASQEPIGIVLLAHSRFDSPFVVGSSHLLRILGGRLGVSLLGVEPFGGWRDPHREAPISNVLSPRLWIPLRFGSPLIRERILAINARLARKQLLGRVKGFPADRCVILDNPYAVDLAVALRSVGFRMILRLTDWMPGQIASPDRETNFRMLRRALEACDAVITTSVPLARGVRRLSGKKATVVTNGVDGRLLEADLERAEASPDRVIFYGALDSRIDLGALGTAAARLPEIEFEVFTPSSSWPKLANLPENIRIRGAIAYADLPAVLSRYAFGILPFTNSPSNHGRFPMKLFEMIGSGVQVIAPPIGALCDGIARLGVRVSGGFDGGALAECLSEARAHWRKTSPEQRTALRAAMREEALKQSWERKADEILNICRSQS